MSIKIKILFNTRQRIPTTYVYYYKSPDHSNNYVLSFAFAFDTDEERYQFALCYPYSYSRCQAYLDQLVDQHPDIVTRETLGKSIQVVEDFVEIKTCKRVTYPGAKAGHGDNHRAASGRD